jgi:hypothetical protein
MTDCISARAPRLGRLAAVCSLAVFIAAACADDAQRTFADADGLLPGDAPALRIEPLLTASGGETGFGGIGTVLADGDGNIYVRDFRANEIVVLDPAGQRVRSIGRAGEGPGEFRALASIAWFGDTLLALDSQLRRIVAFGRDGRVLKTTPWPERSVGGFPHTLHEGGRGAYAVGRINQPRPPDATTGFLGGAGTPAPIIRYFPVTSDLSIGPPLPTLDTIAEPRGFDCEGREGFIATFAAPLLGRAGPLRAISPDGRLVMPQSDSYGFDFVTLASGESAGAVERNYPRRPLTDSEWATATESFRERARVNGPFTCDINELRPTHHRIVRSVVYDDEGRLWVEAESPDGTVMLAALSPDGGQVLAEGRMPARSGAVAPYVRGDRLYLVETDEADVPSVRVYQLYIDGAAGG